MRSVETAVLALPDPAAWDPPTWSAFASLMTVSIAIVAAGIGYGQIRQAVKTRRAQAQPYVAVYIEPTEVSQQYVDLVIKNLGNTAAVDVNVHIEPPPQRSGGSDAPENVDYPKLIKTLVPGQEWRTLWDISTERGRLNLPDSHLAYVSFDAPSQKGKKFEFLYDLDWQFYTGRQWVEKYGMHHAAKALREIEKSTRKWREGTSGGLSVYFRDGDKKDAERREAMLEWQQQASQRDSVNEIGEEPPRSD